MPNIVTHAIYGDLIAEKLPSGLMAGAIQKHHELFYIGCQGPDLFFYYQPVNPTKKADAIRHYPEKLHNHNINQTFSIMTQLAGAQRDDRYLAYLAGFMCHWALDMKCHPYIFYRTQQPDKASGYPDHQFLESAIDQAVSQQFGKNPRNFPNYAILDRPAGSDEVIYEMLKPVFAQEYGIDLSLKTITSSISDFRFEQRFFYNPTGGKEKFWGAVGRLIGQPKAVTALIVPVKTDEDLDPLNLKHALWHDPCDNTAYSTSFIEMGQQAEDIAVSLLKTTEAYCQHKADLSQVIAIIGGRSFGSGHDEQARMRFFQAGQRP